MKKTYFKRNEKTYWDISRLAREAINLLLSYSGEDGEANEIIDDFIQENYYYWIDARWEILQNYICIDNLDSNSVFEAFEDFENEIKYGLIIEEKTFNTLQEMYDFEQKQ